MDTSSATNIPYAPLTNGTTSSASNPVTTDTASTQDVQDRFLKLLVAQMQNQDPMNPMDNAQVTTQLAQIQTVSGISTLNASIGTLGSQFSQMQALQGVSLVGREVSVAGNQLNIASDGTGSGSYSLASPASAVQLDVLNAAGAVISTQQLGAVGTGTQTFSVPSSGLAGNTGGVTFKITATSSSNPVTATTYATDKVTAISNSGGTLSLQLQNLGTVPYTSITAVN